MVITLSKGKVLRLGLLVAALVVLVGLITVYAQGIKAGNVAEESVSSVLSVDFQQEDWPEGLSSLCTETGKRFWTAQLTALERAKKATGLTVDVVKAEAVGRGEPYEGVAGKGQIVTLELAIASHDAAGGTFEEESTLQVLMIQEGDRWLLDGPVPEMPTKEGK